MYVAGNLTDTEKLRDTRSECGDTRQPRRAASALPREASASRCGGGERSVDRLYLRAAGGVRRRGARHTLLLVREDYESQGAADAISVTKGEVVVLLADNRGRAQADWLWVRARDGREGFIPALVAGHGYL
jgi:hypothetical protein